MRCLYFTGNSAQLQHEIIHIDIIIPINILVDFLLFKLLNLKPIKQHESNYSWYFELETPTNRKRYLQNITVLKRTENLQMQLVWNFTVIKNWPKN